MNKLQNIILTIADEIKRICEKYSIPYYICGGTLLGAVRHGGFIPWDDDLDIAMKRKDYERFIDVCGAELDHEKFFLQTEYTERNFAFAFAKVQLLNTAIFENFSMNVPIHHGIFVDIFPMDNLPDILLKRKWFLIINRILKNVVWIKCGYGKLTFDKKLSYKIIKTMVTPISIDWLKEKRHKFITQYNDKENKSLFISDYPDNVYPSTWFNVTKLYDFENTKFPGFFNYDECLTSWYGEYMKLPPEKDRVVHTNYDVDFGPY